MMRRLAAVAAAGAAAAILLAPQQASAIEFWQWNGPHPSFTECEEVRDHQPHTTLCVYRDLEGTFNDGYYFRERI